MANLRGLGGLFLCAVIAAPIAGADGVSVSGGHTGTNLYSNGAAVGPISESGNYSGSEGGNTWNIDAASSADFGALGAMVQGSRTSVFRPSDGSADNALATALSDAQITFGSGSGTFKVHIDFDGSLDVNGARFTTAGIDLRVRHGSFLETALHYERTLLYDDPTGHLTIDEHLVSDPIPFNSSSSVHLVMNLLASIQLQGFTGESPAAGSDFLNTARIAYLEVRDANGNLIDTTAVGGSGQVYPVNVPEPAAVAGLALFGGMSLKRRRNKTA